MSIFPWRKKKKKVCIIGLDGTPFSLILKLIDQGVMPELGKIVSSMNLTGMTVSLPEISSVSWTTFMTGTNPGYHGVYGFTDFVENSYDLRFPNFLDVKVPTLWDVMGRKKKNSIVINQPSTYPARKIPGVLVSGFVAIDMKKAVTPLKYLGSLEDMGYLIDIDTMECREDPDQLRKDLLKTLGSRERAVDYFWDKEDWDLFQVVITGTDRLHHFLWDAYEDTEHTYHDTFMGYYKRIDRFIKKIFDRFMEISRGDSSGEGFFMLSDHGFTGIKQEVYLNAWLQQEGYLSFETENTPGNYNQVSPESRAFALDPGRIYFHTRSRFPRGILEESESIIDLADEISDKLKKIEYEGEPVIRKVFKKEEVYRGPNLNMAPDLVLLSNHGYDLKGSLKQKSVFGRTVLQGMHTWDNAFFLSANPVQSDLNIENISSILISSLK